MLNNYYDTNISELQTGQELRQRGLTLDQNFLESLKIYPYDPALQDADIRIYTVEPTELVFIPLTRTYMQQYEITEKPDFAKRKLAAIQEDSIKKFQIILERLDTFATRPAQSITEALSEGADIDALDQNMLWQYNQIKQANRELLAQLTAATTWEEAEAIRPWVPWEPGWPAVATQRTI